MLGAMNARVRRPGVTDAARSACGGSECALLFSPGMAAALCVCVEWVFLSFFFYIFRRLAKRTRERERAIECVGE